MKITKLEPFLGWQREKNTFHCWIAQWPADKWFPHCHYMRFLFILLKNAAYDFHSVFTAGFPRHAVCPVSPLTKLQSPSTLSNRAKKSCALTYFTQSMYAMSCSLYFLKSTKNTRDVADYGKRKTHEIMGQSENIIRILRTSSICGYVNNKEFWIEL